MITPEQQAKLSEHFPQHKIEIKPKGNGLEYINHGLVTERLLEVDPTWTWEPLVTDERGFPVFDEHGGLWIRLTVCGVTRLGYGDSEGQKGPDAIKGAISDALKIAAARFGVALHVWSQVGKNAKIPAPTIAELRAEDATVHDLIASAEVAGTMDGLTEIFNRLTAAKKSGRIITDEGFKLVKQALTARKEQLPPEPDPDAAPVIAPVEDPPEGEGLWPDTATAPVVAVGGTHP